MEGVYKPRGVYRPPAENKEKPIEGGVYKPLIKPQIKPRCKMRRNPRK